MVDTLLNLRGRLDRFGVLLSGLCMVHCLAGLLLVSLLGLGGEAFLDPAIHRFGLAFAVAIGAATIGIGAWKHGRKLPLAVGSAGLALMGVGLFVPHGGAEAGFTIAGVLLVASAHIFNIRHHLAC